MNLDWLLCYWLFSSAVFVGVLELHLVGVFNYLDLAITGQFTWQFSRCTCKYMPAVHCGSFAQHFMHEK